MAIFNVGEIVREVQQSFCLFRDTPGCGPENRATPEAIGALLVDLRSMTDGMASEAEDLGGQVLNDFLAWRQRLARYESAVDAASPGDRRAVLDRVTAPLLLGWFPGRQQQTRADVSTPFIIANQIGEARRWDDKRVDLLLEDVNDTLLNTIARASETADDIADTIGDTVKAIPAAVKVGAVLGVAYLIWRARR